MALTPLDSAVSSALAVNPNASGIIAAIEATGVGVEFGGNGYSITGDKATVQALIAGYAGSAAELAFHKAAKQTALDALFDAQFDLAKFIRAGTSTTITATNVGTFLATITNNYRSLRASIAAAGTAAAVDAINVAGGWPANP
jgi:hypothetical protein